MDLGTVRGAGGQLAPGGGEPVSETGEGCEDVMGGGLPVPGVEDKDEVAASEVRQRECDLLDP